MGALSHIVSVYFGVYDDTPYETSQPPMHVSYSEYIIRKEAARSFYYGF
jgi:hypothetical protein